MSIVNLCLFQFDLNSLIYYTFESNVKQERKSLYVHASLVNKADSIIL